MSYFKERFNKRLLKNGFKAVIFVLIIAVILVVISPVFMPKTNKELRDKSANGFLAEPTNTIDVLIVGDSESYSTFIPLQIWNDYGISSYVCGTPSQTLAYSEDFLRRAFKNQKPKLVVLETNAIFRKFSLGASIIFRADELFPIYRYHDRWKKLSLADFSSEFTSDYIENDKGYRIDGSVKPVSDSDYMKPSDKKAKMPFQNKSYLKNIMQLCKDNGAELMFVSTPSVKNWNCERHNTVQELADEFGIEYVDMNMLKNQVQIDWSCDTRDAGDHLNYTGAAKATAYFGEYLNSKNIFIDHRNDKNYDSWNQAHKTFLKTVEKSKAQGKNDTKIKKTKSL